MRVPIDVRKCFDCVGRCVTFTTTGTGEPVVLMCDVLHSEIVIDKAWERWPYGKNAVIVKKQVLP
jgi:hypothetical protein